MQVKNFFYRIPVFILSVFLVFILVSFPFQYSRETMNGVSQIERWIAAILFLVIWGFFWKKKEIFQNLKKKRIYPIVFLLLILLQFLVIIVFEIQPINDLLYLHDEAIRMLGDPKISLDVFGGYFAKYPNNYGHLLVLYCLYKILAFAGISTKYFVIAGNLFNMLVIDLGIVFGGMIAKRLRGTKAVNLWMIMFLIHPWTYFWIPYYYTHTISFAIVMILSYAIVYICQEKRNARRYVAAVFLGLVLFVGIKIRITNFIVVIAAVMTWILFSGKKDRKRSDAAVMIIIIVGMLLGCFGYQYKSQNMIPKKNPEQYPMTHWVMMASHGNGRYDYEDIKYTDRFHGTKAKQEANIQKIKENYNELGVKGTLRLVGIKLRAVWLVGDDDFTKMTYSYQHYSRGTDFLSGPDNGWILMYAYLLRFMMMIFILKTVMGLFSHPDKWNYMFMLILLGGMMFHGFWEANPKYSICFMGIMILLQIFGMESQDDGEKENHWLIMIFLLGIVWIFQPFYNYLKDNPVAYDQRYAALQLSRSQTLRWNLNKGDFISQKVRTGTPFQKICFKVTPETDRANMICMLKNEKNQVLEQVEIDNFKAAKSGEINWKLSKKIPEGRYDICLMSREDNMAVSLPVYATKNYDVYSSGDLYINGQRKEQTDALFVLSEK